MNRLKSFVAIAAYAMFLLFNFHAAVNCKNDYQNSAGNVRIKEKIFADGSSYNIDRIDILGNFNIPRYVIIGLNLDNSNVIIELYDIIKKINETENLHGFHGYKQQITLTVVVPDYYTFGFTKVSLPSGMPMNDFKDLKKKISDFYDIDTNSINYLENVFLNSESFIWMQDFAEFPAVWISGYNKPITGILDLQYTGGDTSFRLVEVLKDFFEIPMVFVDPNYILNLYDTDRGGNIEATHEGVIYTGNNISLDLYERLSQMTLQKIITIPTDWLDVGHADEIVAFIPAKNRCGAALVYADPLDALNLINKTGDWKGEAAYDVIESMHYFLKAPDVKKKYYNIDDFNLSKPLRTLNRKPRKTIYSDWLVLNNLKAYIKIREAVNILASASKCLEDEIPAPVLFYEPQDENYSGDPLLIAQNPLTNMLVLRDHVIIPRGEFYDVLAGRIGKVLGGEEKVHSIDALWYEEIMGSIHCATNTIRDPESTINIREEVRSPGTTASNSINYR